MENSDLGVQLEDLAIHHDDNSNQSTDSWKTGLELSKDDNRSSQVTIASSTIDVGYSPSQKITQKNPTITTTQYLI
jgi:hypothetical protein